MAQYDDRSCHLLFKGQELIEMMIGDLFHGNCRILNTLEIRVVRDYETGLWFETNYFFSPFLVEVSGRRISWY